MSDDKNQTSPDRKFIALGEDYEVEYWTKALGVSKDELERAVAQVGNSADKVRERLAK